MTTDEKIKVIHSWGYIEVIENHHDGDCVCITAYHSIRWSKGYHSMNVDKDSAIDDLYDMIRVSIREKVGMIETEINND